ncbi:MAG: Swt1 family HEPN domain-containing protein [Methylobacter sp.]|nr:Swt1 family HEPN domain-containing protein [Methylobacter sp.]
MLSELKNISEVNEQSLVVYARLWQLENWLREMLYVELKSKKGRNWIKVDDTKKTYDADKKLHHMPTPDCSPVSFLTFSELTSLIKKNWALFSIYLPPLNQWEAKLEEIVQIRNRIAHYRKGHSDDLDRLLQLMRDIDGGLWEFCTSYNDLITILPQDKDPVTKKYLELDPFAYKQISENEWAMCGSAPRDMRYIVSVNTIKRKWAEQSEIVDGTPGYLYDIRIVIRNGRQYNYKKFLDQTKTIHSNFVHICLDTFSNSIRVTLPAILGSDKVIKIIDELISTTEYTMEISRQINADDLSVQNLSEKWPEYVLGPNNPLTFLGSDMPCSFFNVIKND